MFYAILDYQRSQGAHSVCPGFRSQGKDSFFMYIIFCVVARHAWWPPYCPPHGLSLLILTYRVRVRVSHFNGEKFCFYFVIENGHRCCLLQTRPWTH